MSLRLVCATSRLAAARITTRSWIGCGSHQLVIRSFSTTGTGTTATGTGGADSSAGGHSQEVYRYGFGNGLRVLKAVSVTGAVTSLCAAPVMAVYGNQSVSVAGRIAMALLSTCSALHVRSSDLTCGVLWCIIYITVGMVGSSTTLAMPALLKSAVLRAALIHPPLPPPGATGDAAIVRPPRLSLTQLSLIGRPITTVVDLDDIESPGGDGTFGTFRAKSTKRLYYVVGDESLWSAHPLLTQLNQRLTAERKSRINTNFKVNLDESRDSSNRVKSKKAAAEDDDSDDYIGSGLADALVARVKEDAAREEAARQQKPAATNTAAATKTTIAPPPQPQPPTPEAAPAAVKSSATTAPAPEPKAEASGLNWIATAAPTEAAATQPTKSGGWGFGFGGKSEARAKAEVDDWFTARRAALKQQQNPKSNADSDLPK